MHVYGLWFPIKPVKNNISYLEAYPFPPVCFRNNLLNGSFEFYFQEWTICNWQRKVTRKPKVSLKQLCFKCIHIRRTDILFSEKYQVSYLHLPCSHTYSQVMESSRFRLLNLKFSSLDHFSYQLISALYLCLWDCYKFSDASLPPT